MTQARRYNKGKLRYELISAIATREKARVYTKGAHKYTLYKDDQGNIIKGSDISVEQAANLEVYEDGSNNWRKGFWFTDVIDSLYRHIEAFRRGEDYDKDMGTLHLSNAAWNLDVLLEQYFTHPELDNRITHIPRIALDIDGVLADFESSFCKRHSIDSRNNHWHFTYQWQNDPHIFEDRDFWMNIEPLVKGEDMPFEPMFYVTSRKCPVDWTKEWLEQNNFPCEPIYSNQDSKVNTLLELYSQDMFDVFVDDAYKHFVELNNAGIPTYLYDKSYNRKYEVGYKRLYNLSDLINY